jgi:hypothetical protein
MLIQPTTGSHDNQICEIKSFTSSTKLFPSTFESKYKMKFSQAVFLFAMLGVASARVGVNTNESDKGEMRNLQEDFIEIPFSIPTNKIVAPGGGGSTLALGGLSDNIRVMVGYKNDQGKRKAIAAQATELLNVFTNVNALTMIIPRAFVAVLANDPDIR